MKVTPSKILVIIAFVLALGATLVGAGVISTSTGGWLLPGSLAAFFLSLLV